VDELVGTWIITGKGGKQRNAINKDIKINQAVKDGFQKKMPMLATLVMFTAAHSKMCSKRCTT
jgi:hypothetical protein